MDLLAVFGRGFLEALFEVGGHDDAVVGGDAEEGEEADPDRDAEVDGVDLQEIAYWMSEYGEVEEPILSVEPDENESARPCEGDAAENKQRDGHFLELEIEDHEDGEEGDGEDDGESLLGADLVFVAADGFGEGDAGGELPLAGVEFSLEEGLGLFYDFHFGDVGLLVENDVADEEGVFAFDHLRAA